MTLVPQSANERESDAMVETNQNIFLVEDDENDVFMFKRSLKKTGIEIPVRLATDGQQAMDMLAASGDPAQREEIPVPSIIFLDLKLPYHNGFEVLKWLRTQSHLQNTEVIILTGSEEPSDRRLADALGARSYLVKPVSPSQIQNALESLRTN
jgi:CheY-like chemotaxis protein